MAASLSSPAHAEERPGFFRLLPFVLMHLAAVGGPFLVGISWKLVALMLASYYLRMLFVCIGYHRYFAHRSYRTGRVFQFVLAFMALTSTQKGVLWWASHHRHHHRYSDVEGDVHSPTLRGFWWSHIGWVIGRKYEGTDLNLIKDFARFPELRLLDRLWFVPPTLYALALLLVGGPAVLAWGFFTSTVVLWHGTFTVNSVAHVWGTRRYATTDTSRNNGWFAFITLGEGWHNNHHHYQRSANNGFFWWELDVSYGFLKALEWVGLVWDVHAAPRSVVHGSGPAPATSPALDELPESA